MLELLCVLCFGWWFDLLFRFRFWFTVDCVAVGALLLFKLSVSFGFGFVGLFVLRLGWFAVVVCLFCCLVCLCLGLRFVVC